MQSLLHRLQGQVSVAASSSLAAEALSERYRDLRALLKLLTRLTQADWAAADSGGGGARDGSAVDVAEVGAGAWGRAGLTSWAPLQVHPPARAHLAPPKPEQQQPQVALHARLHAPFGHQPAPTPFSHAHAQIVFAGLDVLVPLLSPELLKFPKLSRAYFALLAHMLEVRRGTAAAASHLVVCFYVPQPRASFARGLELSLSLQL